jgi:hypothetical protein
MGAAAGLYSHLEGAGRGTVLPNAAAGTLDKAAAETMRRILHLSDVWKPARLRSPAGAARQTASTCSIWIATPFESTDGSDNQRPPCSP